METSHEILKEIFGHLAVLRQQPARMGRPGLDLRKLIYALGMASDDWHKGAAPAGATPQEAALSDRIHDVLRIVFPEGQGRGSTCANWERG